MFPTLLVMPEHRQEGERARESMDTVKATRVDEVKDSMQRTLNIGMFP